MIAPIAIVIVVAPGAIYVAQASFLQNPMLTVNDNGMTSRAGQNFATAVKAPADLESSLAVGYILEVEPAGVQGTGGDSSEVVNFAQREANRDSEAYKSTLAKKSYI